MIMGFELVQEQPSNNTVITQEENKDWTLSKLAGATILYFLICVIGVNLALGIGCWAVEQVIAKALGV